MNLIEAILAKDFIQAKELIESNIKDLIETKLVEMKKMIAEARFKIIKARIRNGKIQRRKKVSSQAGYTFRKSGSGPAKLVRMSALEKRHRKLGARKGKMKRRAHQARSNMKRQRSLRKRKSLGI